MGQRNNLSEEAIMKTTQYDLTWMGTLYGTAIGAGILFLPLQAIQNGIISLLIATIVSLPMVYLSHLSLARVSLYSAQAQDTLTTSFIQFLGKNAGMVANWIYFLCTFSIMVGYALALPKTLVNLFSVFGYQHSDALTATSASRAIFGLIIMALLIGVMIVGRNFVIKATSIIIVPLLISLAIICLLLIPHWNFHNLNVWSFSWGGVLKGCLLIFPIMFFAMNHSPSISEFVSGYKEKISDKTILDKKVRRVLFQSNVLINFFTLFFVYSVLFAIPNNQALSIASASPNLNITGIIADIYPTGILHFLGPVIAITAIISSFFGTFFGTRESLVTILSSIFKCREKVANIIAITFLFLFLWYLTVSDIEILHVLGFLSAPLIALLVFFFPMAVILKNKVFEKYRSPITLIFLFITGAIIIAGYFVGSLL